MKRSSHYTRPPRIHLIKRNIESPLVTAQVTKGTPLQGPSGGPHHGVGEEPEMEGQGAVKRGGVVPVGGLSQLNGLGHIQVSRFKAVNQNLFPFPTHVHHKMFDSCLQNLEEALIGRAQGSTVGIAANENIVG